MALAFALPILLLAPFVNRAYNIDEPMFIWVAQRIVEHPFDFFGGSIERGGGSEPMYMYNQNPPGFSYVLAVFGAIGGWGEPVLRLASLLAAGLCSLGTYTIAARFSPRPLLATAAMLLTPGFLVSAASVMTDVTLVAFYVWAMYTGVKWIDTRDSRWLALTIALISAGALMKYYAVTAAPLIVLYALLRRMRPGPWIAAFFVPALVLIAFWWVSWRLYGVNLLSVAAEVAQDPSVRQGDSIVYRELVTLFFVGGCFGPMALFAPAFMRPVAIVFVVLGLGVLLLFGAGDYPFLQLMLGTITPYDGRIAAHLGVMSAAGLALVWLPFHDANQRRDPESFILVLWVFGAILYTVYVNHLINARTLLPAAPALGILLARNVPVPAREAIVRRAVHGIPLAAGLALSVWVLLGDYAVAENARTAAKRGAARAQSDGAALYYSGEWGFQYYVQQAGAGVLLVDGADWGEELRVHMQHGDLIAVSSEGREKWRHPPSDFVDEEFYARPNRFGVATYHPLDEAGFYSHLTGIIPYKFGLVQREEYGLYRWTGPDYAPATLDAP